jgi:hypothetical protein
MRWPLQQGHRRLLAPGIGEAFSATDLGDLVPAEAIEVDSFRGKLLNHFWYI